MLLLLSQTITSAKILLTPGNTNRNTDQPVPICYFENMTEDVVFPQGTSYVNTEEH
jgi:hypothetical protein